MYPDSIAGKVTDALGAKFGNAPSFVASVEGCRARDAAAGVQLSINLPVATAPAQVAHANAWAQAVNEAEKARAEGPSVLSLAALHPDCEGKPELVAQIAAAGVVVPDGFPLEIDPVYALDAAELARRGIRLG